MIKTMIAQFTDGDHTTWDAWLPEIAFAYNTARHEATGSTQAALNFGREFAAPGDPRLTADNITEEPTPESINQWQQRLTDIKDRIELARWNLERVHQNQKHHYDLRRREWRPSIGDRVLKREHHLSAAAKQFNAKLAPKFASPYTVFKFTGPNVVVLKGARGKTVRAHLSDLKPCDTREPTSADSAAEVSATRRANGWRQPAEFAPRPLGGRDDERSLASEDARHQDISAETNERKNPQVTSDMPRSRTTASQKVPVEIPPYHLAPSWWALRSAIPDELALSRNDRGPPGSTYNPRRPDTEVPRHDS